MQFFYTNSNTFTRSKRLARFSQNSQTKLTKKRLKPRKTKWLMACSTDSSITRTRSSDVTNVTRFRLQLWQHQSISNESSSFKIVPNSKWIDLYRRMTWHNFVNLIFWIDLLAFVIVSMSSNHQTDNTFHYMTWKCSNCG